MSLVSQTPAQRPAWLTPRLWVPGLAAAAIVFTAVSPFGRYVVRAAGEARLHGPDLELFAGLSPTVKVHMLAALAALILGAVLMLVRKGRLFHRAAGWTWVALAATVAGSSIFITDLNHGSWSLIHLFTGWVLLALPLAVAAAKRHNVSAHRKTMTGLFYGGFAINLFIAFIPGRTMWNLFLG
jgi:uncharacterized membrane protein